MGSTEAVERPFLARGRSARRGCGSDHWRRL